MSTEVYQALYLFVGVPLVIATLGAATVGVWVLIARKFFGWRK